ncbi:hypothetical protein HBI68_122810 [Parastagonospora nodorum]|nr:hypothetical protein HBI76_141510 [Parastagonospora nodorum]KAH5031129.1 hypothetical protein HBI74_086760 [Parastagonospora nodorum]KAH6161705.1 hypothetical protein HBI68_122810 [Parastagonospora nodorum]
MSKTPPYFDFLNLPREIRDEIYEYTLCSFSHDQRLYDIESCAHVYSWPRFIERKFLGNLNLLLANKQIHGEGYKCMLKKNIFVRFECRALELGNLIHGQMPPVFFSSYCSSKRRVDAMADGPLRVDHFPWYNMLVQIQEFGDSSRGDCFAIRPVFDAIMLLENCADLFSRLEVEMATTRLPSPDSYPLEILVYPDTQEMSHRRQKRYRGLGQISYPPREQKKLLRPIKEELRSFPNLEIYGCDDEAFALEVARDVSKPLQTSWQSVNTQLEHHTRSAEKCWEMDNLTACAQSCARGLSLIRRVSSSIAAIDLPKLEDTENTLEIGRLVHTLYFFLARCTHTHLSAPAHRRIRADEQTHLLVTSEAMCELFLDHQYLDRLWPVYDPPQHERAGICYIKSRTFRLHKEHAHWVPYWVSQEDPMAYITEALELSPDSEIFKEEKSIIEIWVKDHVSFVARKRSFLDNLDRESMVEWRKRCSNTASAV